MSCGCKDRPAPRREQATVPTGSSGEVATVRLGECHPNQLGWVLSLGLETRVANTQPEFILHGQDIFLGSAEVAYGDQNGGILVTQGGLLYCPWPTVQLDFFDGLASGANSPLVSVIGRPVLSGDVAGASMRARGMSTADIADSGDNSFTVPSGVIAYWVSSPDDGGNIEIKADDGVGETVSNYKLSGGGVDYPLVAPSPWRDIPLWDADTAPAIEVTNNSGGEFKFTVHWLYDLGVLR